MTKMPISRVHGRTARVLAVVAAAHLGACAANNTIISWNPSTEARLAMEEQVDAFTKTVLEGATFGGTIGTIIGALVAGNPIEGAQAGGAIGALATGAAAVYIAQQQERYATEEERLDGLIQDVEAKNVEAQATVAAMEVLLEEHRRTLALLRQQVAAGEATSWQLEHQTNLIRQDKRTIAEAAGYGEALVETFKEVRKATPTEDAARAALADEEIERLRTQVDVMGDIVAQLADLEGSEA